MGITQDKLFKIIKNPLWHPIPIAAAIITITLAIKSPLLGIALSTTVRVTLFCISITIISFLFYEKKGGFFSDKKHLRLRIILFWIPIISLFIAIDILTKRTLLQDTFILGLLLLAFHVFFYSVLIFNSALAKEGNILRLSRGEMRRAIAIILTIAYISVLFLNLANIVESKSQYTLYFAYGVYGAIICFYFKSRGAERVKMDDLIKEGNVEEVLKMRYALGELSENEFKDKIRRLNEQKMMK